MHKSKARQWYKRTNNKQGRLSTIEAKFETLHAKYTLPHKRPLK